MAGTLLFWEGVTSFTHPGCISFVEKKVMLYRRSRIFRIAVTTIIIVTIFLLTKEIFFIFNDTERKLSQFISIDTEREYCQSSPIWAPNIKFSINMEDYCIKSDLDMIIIGFSANNNSLQRKRMRNYLDRMKNLIKIDFKLIFMLGITDTWELQEKINTEARDYGDIIQAGFYDTYNLLTYKSLAITKWVSIYCLNAKYVLKIDDDVFVNLVQLDIFLHKMRITMENTFVCDERSNNSVLREGKYAVPASLFPDKYYPTFCGGPVYLTSPQVYKKVYCSLKNTTFLPMEDVFYTGIVREMIDYKIFNINSLFGDFYRKTNHKLIDINRYMFVHSRINVENWPKWSEQIEAKYKMKGILKVLQ